jgi:hypothetical protein
MKPFCIIVAVWLWLVWLCHWCAESQKNEQENCKNPVLGPRQAGGGGADVLTGAGRE